MSTESGKEIAIDYDKAVDAYLRSLTPENLMEAPPQATQRSITLASLALVSDDRSDVQVFNELLVQYPHPSGQRRRPRQVVPDNAVMVWPEPLQIERSFNLVEQPCKPFWVMEYVSKTNERKDYEESMHKYEHELKVPYYLLFVPEEQELTLYRHNGEKYFSVQPNEHGRYAIPELEMEVGVLDGWVRFWYRGALLPLPAELKRELDKVRREAEQEKKRAEQEKKRAEQEKKRAEQEKKRAEQEKKRAEQEKKRAEKARAEAEREKKRAEAAEAEAERLRKLLAQIQQGRQPE
jgi:Uma2 family endonuclease